MSQDIERCHAELAALRDADPNTPAYLLALAEMDWRRELEILERGE